MPEAPKRTNGMDTRTQIFLARLVNLESIFIIARIQIKKIEANNKTAGTNDINSKYDLFLSACKSSGETIVAMLFQNGNLNVALLDDLEIEILAKIVELSRNHSLTQEQRPIVAENIDDAVLKEKEKRDRRDKRKAY